MKKILKIRFVKFENAIVAQQIGVSGIEFFNRTEHIGFLGYGFDFAGDAIGISLSPARLTKRISAKYLDSNEARDEYLDKVVKWISEEQFATGGKLEIGKLCEVSDDNKDWQRRTLLAVLPKTFLSKYIAAENYSDLKWCGWEYARPIASCGHPKIDGDIYTWEMEVSDER